MDGSAMGPVQGKLCRWQLSATEASTLHPGIKMVLMF